MPSPSYFVTVEIEIMADCEEDAERGVQSAMYNMIEGDIIEDARVFDVAENVPLKD
jgi:hypothetical protein